MKKREKAVTLVERMIVNATIPGDLTPPFIPSPGALRTAKSRGQDEFERDMTLALRELKKEAGFSGVIRRIEDDPFGLFFVIPSQLIFYKDYLKRNGQVTMAIDATGSLIRTPKKWKPTPVKNRHVFLYAGCVGKREATIVMNFLSTTHTAGDIAANFWRWLQAGFKVNDFIMPLNLFVILYKSGSGKVVSQKSISLDHALI